ncbi:MAG: N-acetyltransferase [Firmicutes bacterium]|nr:N-acetyltransferase [Bacillota bacterium]
MIHVQEIEKKRNTLKEFVDFPWELYRNDPYWVPPLHGQMIRTLMGVNNPLLANGPHTFFLAYDKSGSGRKVVGRIMVGVNEKLNREKKKNEGYISLFESVNNKEVAFALFQAAAGWLKKKGLSVMVGPVSPTNGDDSRGVLIKGFDGPPVLMNSYNPPYYQEFFNEFGFEKQMDLFAYHLKAEEMDVARYGRVVAYAMKRYNFRIDRFDRKNVLREAKDIKKILDLAMPETWEHLTPPSLEEIFQEMQALIRFMDEDLVYIARSGDEPIGFVVALPDYNQVLKKVNGRLFPFGFAKFLWYRRKITGIRIFMQFVIPKFRNKAVNSAIYHRLMLEAARKGYTFGEGSTIAEMNKESIRNVERVGGRLYRIYRIYCKEL